LKPATAAILDAIRAAGYVIERFVVVDPDTRRVSYQMSAVNAVSGVRQGAISHNEHAAACMLSQQVGLEFKDE
jgi:hypothetical protein